MGSAIPANRCGGDLIRNRLLLLSQIHNLDLPIKRTLQVLTYKPVLAEISEAASALFSVSVPFGGLVL